MNDFNPEQALSETRREFGEHGGVTPSISRSSTFTVIDPETMPEIFGGIRGPQQGGCFLYSRHFNPTVDILSRYLSAMEGTEFAVCTASGMSAISCTLLQLCRKGDHIVFQQYHLWRYPCPAGRPAAPIRDHHHLCGTPRIRPLLKKRSHPATRVLYTEALGNPTSER